MKSKLVLVVDDDKNILKMLEIALTGAGYRVACADSGRSAMEFLAGETPDAIVLDIVMPDIDGYSFFTEIRSIPSLEKVPVIISSGKGGLKSYFDLEEERFRPDAFLSKPYEMKELTRVIKKLAG